MALILLRCFVISRFALLSLLFRAVLSQFRCSPIELIPESITSRCERSKIVAIAFFLAQTREASCSVSGDKNASFEWQTDEYRCAPVYITCVWVLCAGNIIILCIALLDCTRQKRKSERAVSQSFCLRRSLPPPSHPSSLPVTFRSPASAERISIYANATQRQPGSSGQQLFATQDGKNGEERETERDDFQ